MRMTILDSQRGASLLEYAVITAILIVGLAALMPSVEQATANRVNCGTTHYQSWDLDESTIDPNNPATPIGGCPEP